jgi:hypothetical protein
MMQKTDEDGKKLASDLTILPRIFQDNMPKLKSLTLANVSSWPHNRFHNLTNLRLENQPYHARATLPEFLEFLASSPKLEVLVLVCAGPAPSEIADADAIAPVVVLPYLQYLEIGWPDQWRSKGRHLSMLLQHLDIPTTAVRCFYEEEPYPLIGHHLMQIRYESLKQIVQSSRKIVLTSHSIGKGYESFVGLRDSTLYFNYPKTAPILTSPLTTMLRENVEDLVYAPSSTWDCRNFSSLLGQLPSLRRLVISAHMWYCLEEVARVLQERDSVNRKCFKYVPLLEELHIYPPEKEGEEQTEEGVDSVIMLCNVRANNGCFLKAVVLNQFSKESIDRIRDYFDEVQRGSGRKDLSMDDTLGSYWRSYNRFQPLV